VKVQGLPGTYIVNQYSPSNQPQTLITFNQGGHWSPVAAPEQDVNGQPTNCHLVTGSVIVDNILITRELHSNGNGSSRAVMGLKLMVMEMMPAVLLSGW